MPRDFITYDMIKEIGEFRSFEVLSNEGYANYSYTVCDENGVDIIFTASHLHEREFDPEYSAFSEPDDLRHFSIEPNVNAFFNCEIFPDGDYVQFDDVSILRYNDSALTSVSWCFSFDVHEYVIKCTVSGEDTGGLADYPIDGEETFVGNILSKKGPGPAIDELVDSWQRLDPVIVIYFGIFISAVMITIVVLVVLYIFRRRKRAVTVTTEPSADPAPPSEAETQE